MARGLTTIDGITCHLVGPVDRPEPPEAVVIFSHGYGAGGNDLVPLANEICQIEPSLAEKVFFIFPEAPLTVPEVPGGRAWWPIDIEELQRAAQQGEFRDMRQQSPPELPDARSKLMSIIDVFKTRTKLPLSRFVLGGFSQGSMLATDVALRLPESVGGLIVFSGTLLGEQEWRELAPNRSGLKVLQSHGSMDTLLPHEAAEWLRDLLTDAGAEVDFLSFPGMHTIPAEAIDAAAAMIADIVASPRET